MNRLKIVTLLYFAFFAISAAILLNICLQLNNLFIPDNSIELIKIQYSHLQKSAGIYGIIAFMVLLVFSFVLYFLTSKRTYILLSNILYIGVVLFVFFTANRAFYAFQNIDCSKSSGYWLTLFIGVFYIIGAVLVSVIGYITIRNFTNRSQQSIHKGERKN